MNSSFKVFKSFFIMILFVLSLMVQEYLHAQEVHFSTQNKDTLLFVAREYIKTVQYCALITVDSTGQPNVRAMDPFPPDENMVVFLGTNRKSRKVQEISNNHRVTLYYADHRGVGYVAIIGTASFVDDPEEKAVWWKEEWEQFYKDQKENYILIKVIPEKLEILNYRHNIIGDMLTWRAPYIEFKVTK